jgi:hypothetical protein
MYHPVFYNFYAFANKPPLPIHMLSKWLISLLHNLNLLLGLSLSGHCKSKVHKAKQFLLKKLKQCIHSDIKTYINHHSVSSLVKASNMADDYVLTQ